MWDYPTNELFSNQILHQPQNFTRCSVAMRLQFRKQQLPVHRHFEPAALRGHQPEFFDHMLVVLQQFICQAHGPTGVVSDRAINDLDFQHNRSSGAGILMRILQDYIIAAGRAKMPAPFHLQGWL